MIWYNLLQLLKELFMYLIGDLIYEIYLRHYPIHIRNIFKDLREALYTTNENITEEFSKL